MVVPLLLLVVLSSLVIPPAGCFSAIFDREQEFFALAMLQVLLRVPGYMELHVKGPSTASPVSKLIKKAKFDKRKNAIYLPAISFIDLVDLASISSKFEAALIKILLENVPDPTNYYWSDVWDATTVHVKPAQDKAISIQYYFSGLQAPQYSFEMESGSMALHAVLVKRNGVYGVLVRSVPEVWHAYWPSHYYHVSLLCEELNNPDSEITAFVFVDKSNVSDWDPFLIELSGAHS